MVQDGKLYRLILIFNAIHTTKSPKPTETTPFYDYW